MHRFLHESNSTSMIAFLNDRAVHSGGAMIDQTVTLLHFLEAASLGSYVLESNFPYLYYN